MSEQINKGLVPELRFPEFALEREWIKVSISMVAELKSGYAFKSSDYKENGGFSVITISNVQDGHFDVVQTKKINQLPNDLQPHQLLKVGDILVSMTGNVGRVCMVDKEKCLLNQRVGKLIPHKLDKSFFYFILKNDAFGTEIRKKAVGAAQGNVSSTDILGYSFYTPILHSEQQKIASCLASLDELISANTQKLEALKAHKKGLMQQLFPAEGETVPRLRFPEFEGDGEWKVVELEKISHKIMVGIASAATHAYRKSGIILFRNQNIKEGYLSDNDILYIDETFEKEHKSKRLKEGDLLTARTGYPGTTCLVPKKYEGSQSFTTLITRPKTEIVNSTYLCFYINSEKGQSFFNSTKIGGGQQNVNAGSLAEMPIPHPSIKEQQKIAFCLSSLDALITAQSEKIESLKTHKKGLMQGLFPTLK